METKGKIYIGTDHRGFELKQAILPKLTELGYEVVDVGAKEYIESDDYVDYALDVAEKVAQDSAARGVLFCGSGIGMTLAANKVNGITAAQVKTVAEAK